ncbi:MAG: DUF1552 domain-containing protein [Fimbriimonadaceae bacterium]|nr:DUF1552 domain-containing protein [Fimbriimonadaceae bacterium]
MPFGSDGETEDDNNVSYKSLPRRTFLKGIGTAMALPLLEKMLPLTAVAQSMPTQGAPMRMAFMFVPNGINMEHWVPPVDGALTQLPYTLEPLKGVKDNINVLTGLAQHKAHALGDGPGDHARSSAVWLTGVHPKKTAGSDINVGISADQVAAQAIGKETRFASLELGCERGAVAGDCDSGYSCAYSTSISWRSATTPNAKEVNPRLVFERLFGRGSADEQELSKQMRDRYRKSVLDFVLEDANRLSKQLGIRDQQKLDEYLTGVREIEERILKMERENPAAFIAGNRPSGIPSDYGEHIRLMGDMMILAFQADLTRISTFMFANEGSNRSYGLIGVKDGHHDISHHGKDPVKLESKKQIDRFHMVQLAYILERMKNTKELDGTLLDHSMVVYGGGISDGDRHNHDDLPILFAGSAKGTIRTGRHVRYQPTPMNNLFLSMLDKVGVRVETLGDSTGKLQGLF